MLIVVWPGIAIASQLVVCLSTVRANYVLSSTTLRAIDMFPKGRAHLLLESLNLIWWRAGCLPGGLGPHEAATIQMFWVCKNRRPINQSNCLEKGTIAVANNFGIAIRDMFQTLGCVKCERFSTHCERVCECIASQSLIVSNTVLFQTIIVYPNLVQPQLPF